MPKKVTFWMGLVFLFLAVFVVSGCLENIPSLPSEEEGDLEGTEEAFEGDVKASGSAAWTVIVYMAADNNLYPYALRDLQEMRDSGIGAKDRVNVVVLFDGGGSTKYYSLQEGKVLDIWSGAGNLNTGDGETLAEFIQFVRNQYPARRYALILWNHGAGWRNPVKGICWDDSAGGDYLTLPELAFALRAGGVRFNLIGMDACLMAMVEVAYEIRNYGDILVASQAEEPGDGWNYGRLFRRLAKSPTMSPTALAQEIVKSYFAYYGGGSLTLSVIRLSRVGALAEAISGLAGVLLRSGKDIPALNDRAVSPDSPYVDEESGYVDIENFVRLLKKWNDRERKDRELKSALTKVQTKLKSTVIYNRASGYYLGAKGLSIHLPYLPYYANSCPSFGASDYGNLAFARDTQWDEFLDLWCS
ncbi:clostripain-related cysteine peptidase [Candidatus Caldatribacterium sp. SIUC1]|uniref:clostripain-related cysteine peptidase n=1 Tax=Candidatus Caldatribacterium sp. SIUC1 TaxID=3418365 RepID=UPI003F6932A0